MQPIGEPLKRYKTFEQFFIGIIISDPPSTSSLVSRFTLMAPRCIPSWTNSMTSSSVIRTEISNSYAAPMTTAIVYSLLKKEPAMSLKDIKNRLKKVASTREARAFSIADMEPGLPGISVPLIGIYDEDPQRASSSCFWKISIPQAKKLKKTSTMQSMIDVCFLLQFFSCRNRKSIPQNTEQ